MERRRLGVYLIFLGIFLSLFSILFLGIEEVGTGRAVCEGVALQLCGLPLLAGVPMTIFGVLLVIFGGKRKAKEKTT
jgi:hypothetical protein